MLSSSVCSFVASTFPAGEGKGDANMCLHNIIRYRNNVHPKRVAGDVDPYGFVRYFTHKPSLPPEGKAKGSETL